MTESEELVREIFFEIHWHPGFARVQKEKRISKEFHAAADKDGFRHLLEISTKAKSERGRHLSVFHMKVNLPGMIQIPLEWAFQGSKVFERGGPFTDLYSMELRDAKRDPRLNESGSLPASGSPTLLPTGTENSFLRLAICHLLKDWPDWAAKLYAYGGFTDVEFNPHRSINCQARSVRCS